MPIQRYEVTQPHVDTLLAWVAGGKIAIPRIQRPVVWQATGVRSLMDSLMRSFPVALPDRLAQPRRQAQGRLALPGQAHPH